MIPAIIGAAGAALGTMGGITGGYKRGAYSTLNPMQQLQMFQMISALNPRMKDHFAKLDELGQAPQNAYDTLPGFMGEYQRNVNIPSRQRQAGMVNRIGDPAHRRAAGFQKQDFLDMSMLSGNQLRNNLMMKDLGMQTAGMESTYDRQLGALGAMGDTWMMPMGQVRENYVTPKMGVGDYASIGMQGLKTGMDIASGISDWAKSFGGGSSIPTTYADTMPRN